MNFEDLVIMTALESGFAVSSRHGQSKDKLMPVSDKETLVKFAEALLKERGRVRE